MNGLIWKVLWINLFCNTALVVCGQDWRTLNGSDNNLNYPAWGSVNESLLRIVPSAYDDSVSGTRSANLPNSRRLSNEIVAQSLPVYNSHGISDMFWNFGQFLDHDLVINRGNSGELILVDVPKGDLFFDPFETGNVTLRVDRGQVRPGTGTGKDNPREHINQITAFLDGSVIYGVDPVRLAWMRTGSQGKMKVSEHNLLPYNTFSGQYFDRIDFNAPFMELPPQNRPEKYFVNGDIRTNEQPALASLHILFLREHNRLCEEISGQNPGLSDEEVFQQARKWLGAYLQSITYYEWLPMAGVELEPYTGYNDEVNPGISNLFSAATFRFGHSLVNETILRIDEQGEVSRYGSIHIKDAFFKTETILNEGGIEPILRGLTVQLQQELDVKIVGTLRNFLFGPPGSGGMDLAVMNIERARERGIPALNNIRKALGLEAYDSFDFIAEDDIRTKFSSLYQHVDYIDPWIGMLAEPEYNGSIFGETMYFIIKDQFERLRDGDRFWFENDPFFSEADLSEIHKTHLRDIILRNTSISSLPENVFRVDETSTILSVEPLEGVREIQVSAYPNPFVNEFSIFINSYKSWGGMVKITDLQGRVVLNEKIQVGIGENIFKFELNEHLNKGLYLLEIESEAKIGRFKLLKQ